MQTRHPRQYGPNAGGGIPGQVLEASEEGLTVRARPFSALPFLCLKESARGGVCINLGSDGHADDFLVADATTGGVKINPELLP